MYEKDRDLLKRIHESFGDRDRNDNMKTRMVTFAGHDIEIVPEIAYRVYIGGITEPLGPFSTEGEAKRAIEKALGKPASARAAGRDY